MDATKNYKISFNGLQPGTHEYEFEAGNDFFKAFDHSEISSGNVAVKVVLLKATGTLHLDFDIQGSVNVECDRCLEDCPVPINYTGTLVVKFTDAAMDDSERYDGEVLWLGPRDGELNIAQYIYESVVLSLPVQRVHNDAGDCNQQMLERFRIVSEEEFEKLTTPKEQTLEDNPQWEKLKELKDKL